MPQFAFADEPAVGLESSLIVDHVMPIGAKTILIHGAAGAVGSLAVQIAKSIGLTVYANAAMEDEPYLKEIGVDRVVDYKTQSFEEIFHGLDAIVELVGGQTLEKSYQCVKHGGLVVSTVGPLNEEVAKKYHVQTKYFLTDQKVKGLDEIAKLVESGKVKPRLAQIMPLEKAAETQRLSETGRSHGK